MATPDQSALALALQMLQPVADAGLTQTFTDAYNAYLTGAPIDKVLSDVRASSAYQARFPGMAALNAAGQSVSEAEYISKEATDTALMKAYGIPDQMITRDELGKLIGGQTSSAELQQRLELRKQVVSQLPAAVTDYLQREKGISAGDLIGFWENPDVALPILEQKTRAAQVGAAAQQAGFGDLDPATALRLAGMHNLDSLGMVDQTQVGKEFGTAAQLRGLTQALPGQTAGVSQDQLLSATVGGDAQAQLAVQQAQDAARAKFAGGGDYLTGSKGAAGLGQNLA